MREEGIPLLLDGCPVLFAGPGGPAAAKAARQLAEADRPAVTVTALSGFAGQELIDASRGADLPVIGSRGQRGFPALRVSEIATKVAHYADCPVVIVPPAR